MRDLLSLTPKLPSESAAKHRKNLDPKIFGKKLGLIASLFGCRHKVLSRPISHGHTAYRTCLECGSRKPFDPETFESLDGFYQAPIVKVIEC
jgi:hypothetical protein